ncbi:hypothetical protein PVOR_18634 [Paenibacillus vortex V453]|uniref:Uncharacterized protein n=1 Tax=Paenibacillus vortex V453 TaxID=715225 RepID=A0A2R9SU81_9BACL|nr:hypothetical protein PVOR_18634 [Paenibacillus vortex V453]
MPFLYGGQPKRKINRIGLMKDRDQHIIWVTSILADI